ETPANTPSTQPAAADDEAPHVPPREEIVLGEHTFTLELALTEDEWAVGLMGRPEIEPTGGMLFVYPTSRRLNFWMKFCETDIDVIFVDARGRITAMYAMPKEPPRREDESLPAYEARLPRYSSRYFAQFAIELAPGWLERLDLEVGQRLDLDFDRFRELGRERRRRRLDPDRRLVR
ncbi:MAG: DUF192 domain-containing protein, partial [Phycisphaerales bacterium]|nr:DUF192 domain-containing protein [Phycisphaerales bacterium]